MRDFARLTSLIKSVAILRHKQRQRDRRGRIIAQIDDYVTIFNLVGPMYEATLTGATKEIRATVQTVEEMLNERNSKSWESITATTLAARLGVNRSTASRRVNAAIKRGWIVNRETKKGQPWDLQIGEPMPETQGLPLPEALKACCAVAPVATGVSGDATPQPNEIIEDNDNCCTVSPLTGSFTPSFVDEDMEKIEL
jgi:hypothetical protein